jgi:hypothetical protein
MLNSQEILNAANTAADNLSEVISENITKLTKEQIKKFMQAANRFLTTVGSAASLIAEQENELKHLREKIKQQNLSNVNNTTGHKSLDICDAISELAERNTRAKNIIVHNIPEPDTSLSPAEQNEHNSSQVTQVLANVDPNVSTKIQRTHRLGRHQVGKMRPLKVVFRDSDCANEIMFNRRGLPPNIKIKSDLTDLQREHLRKLWTEVEERKTKGDDNITVKFINATPRIVPLRKKN